MNTYIFKTTTTMKPYNRKNWWIMDDIIGEMRINAENVSEALKEYRDRVNDNTGINISINALKTKSPMYVDAVEGITKQTGFVITGSTDFDDNHYRWVKQYIDLWVTILTVIDTDFEAVA